MTRTPLAKRFTVGLLAPAYAFAVAMLVGNVAILISHESPRAIWGLLLSSTWGSGYGIGQVLFKATALAFAGYSVAISFRTGLFNVGAEGQIQLGALTCAVTAAYLPAGLPSFIVIPLAVGAAVLASGVLGGFAGWLRVRFGAHEVITTIMLNFIVAAFIGYVLTAGLAEPESLHTKSIPASAELPRLGDWFSLMHGSAASVAVFLVVLVALLYRWFLVRTRLGLEFRAVGLSPSAAEANGISVMKVRVLSMMFAGGIAALASVSSVLGYKHVYELGFGAGAGFMGIAVALLGRGHYIGIALAALLFGTLSQGGLAINARVPKDLVDVLQATVILTVIIVTAAAKKNAAKVPA